MDFHESMAVRHGGSGAQSWQVMWTDEVQEHVLTIGELAALERQVRRASAIAASLTASHDPDVAAAARGIRDALMASGGLR